MRLALASLLVAANVAAAQSATGLPTAPPPALDAYGQQVMRQFEVPGVALAIVKDGKVVLAKGYGVRRMGESAPVDGRTRFGIASNTKAFTATALGMLVEEGKIEWDAPVVRYLPAFAMYDPWVTREITVRDLLVHRSGLGLGAGDLLWWPESSYDRKEIVRRIRFIPPATSFRTAYAYDNVLYTVAGEVIEAVTGTSWEEFVARRILAPVGMTGSDTRYSAAAEGGNVATPHAEVDGRVRQVAAFSSDNVNPAGGIDSSAEDMARWMIVQLDSGRLANGERLFQPATTRELWSIVTPIRPSPPPPALAAQRSNVAGYALGFGIADYRGRLRVQHSGGLPGYLSLVTMIPELKLGVAVLTNQESGFAFSAITYRIIDHYLGAPPLDYPGIYARLREEGQARIAAAEERAAAARDRTRGPSLPPAGYAGRYRDAWYGDVVISDEGGRLVIRFAHTPSLVGDLQHWQYDTFVTRWRDRELRADAFITFALKPDGTVERAMMQAVSAATDFSFDFQDLVLRPVAK